MNRPQLICVRCNHSPSELDEYIDAARRENMTPDDYVWEEEGTLNRENGHFVCTECYLAVGMPSSPRGWVTP